jgi:hypothetical protein
MGGRMLAEALIALAAAGGTAVVQAAGTDAWEGLRGRVARWFGRGDVEVERAELERLDRSASELSAADEGETDRIGARQEAAWQARFETLLERLPEAERAQAATELEDLIDQSAPGPVVGGRCPATPSKVPPRSRLATTTGRTTASVLERDHS